MRNPVRTPSGGAAWLKQDEPKASGQSQSVVKVELPRFERHSSNG